MEIILFVLCSILALQLFYLTGIKGNYYRNISDNIRLKDVVIQGPRGNIYDRNGEVLAGNISKFTLQILKDEFNFYQ